LIAQDLPEIEQHKRVPQRVDEYAKATHVDVDWVHDRLNKGKPLPRSMCGIPVGSNENPWGVIVIDSVAPGGVQDNAMQMYQMFGNSLNTMLKKV
jgi:hypothetical protein